MAGYKVGLQCTYRSGHCSFNWEAYLAKACGLALPEAAAVAWLYQRQQLVQAGSSSLTTR